MPNARSYLRQRVDPLRRRRGRKDKRRPIPHEHKAAADHATLTQLVLVERFEGLHLVIHLSEPTRNHRNGHHDQPEPLHISSHLGRSARRPENDICAVPIFANRRAEVTPAMEHLAQCSNRAI